VSADSTAQGATRGAGEDGREAPEPARASGSGALAASRAVAERIADAEAERDAAAGQVAAIEAQPKAADVLPSPAAVRAHVEALGRVLAADVERGRDFLRRHVGTVRLTPKSDGPRPFYRASGRLFFSAIDPKAKQVAGPDDDLF
jgi:hypothetical protein